MTETQQDVPLLAQQECEPCKGNARPLHGSELEEYVQGIDPAWEVIREHHLHREFKCGDFREALELTNRIGNLAEQQNHHPDICLSWGKVEVTLYSHKIDGLHRNDFILAAKIDPLRPGEA